MQSRTRLGRGLGALISESGPDAQVLGRILTHRKPPQLAALAGFVAEPPHFVGVMDGILHFLLEACRADLAAYYSVKGPNEGQFFYRLDEEAPFDPDQLKAALGRCVTERPNSKTRSIGRPMWASNQASAKSPVPSSGDGTAAVWRGASWRGTFLISGAKDGAAMPPSSMLTLACDLMDLLESKANS